MRAHFRRSPSSLAPRSLAETRPTLLHVEMKMALVGLVCIRSKYCPKGRASVIVNVFHQFSLLIGRNGRGHWHRGSHRGHMDWVRQRDRRSEGILGPVVQHRNPLTRGKYEFWDIDRVGKRVLAQWLVSVVITVAARIRAGVMQLRHRRAEQRLGLGLNRLVEPGIKRSRKLASHHNRGIKLNWSPPRVLRR